MIPEESVKIVCGEFYVPGKYYPGNLPAEIKPWYAYCRDGGHCIVCCLPEYFNSEKDLTNELLPVPVKSVLRGYKIKNGYVVVDLPYSSEIGLITPTEDDEF